MSDIENLTRNTERTFKLVCVNFAMLLILFIGIGYVLWQSASLVRTLKSDVQRAEQAVMDLRDRFADLDAQSITRQIVQNVAEELRKSVANAVRETDLGRSLAGISESVSTTAERVDRASESIVEINERLKEADADAIAERVSYHILKGLGDGFTAAAESRDPGPAQ